MTFFFLHSIMKIFFFCLFLQQQGNDYSSYHNTLGGHRTGTLLPHASPSSVYNKYSYATDLSLSSNSHYGYTSWGLWRGAGGPGTDSRNISPSIYSHHNGSKKRRRNIKSFSILLMSAAMIVVLAVLAVAGLAFYFSTFKSDPTDCKYNYTLMFPFPLSTNTQF